MQIQNIQNSLSIKSTLRQTAMPSAKVNFVGKYNLGADILEINKNKFKISNDDIKLSKKISDALSALPEDSLLAVGKLKSLYFKFSIKYALNDNSLKLKKENLKNIHVLNVPELGDTLVISKFDDKHLAIFGNIKKLNRKTLSEKIFGTKYKEKQIIEYGDTIETYNNKKRLIITNQNNSEQVELDGIYPIKTLDTNSVALK